MRQLVFTGPRSSEWIDAKEPALTGRWSAIVEPLVVSTCDMDAVAMSGLIPFRPGTPLGHEGVGVVREIARGVTAVVPGDRVIIPWQISCGFCDRCRRGQDTFCATVPAGSCYGWGPHVKRWGGFFGERIEVPYADHMLVPLPPGMDAVRASGISDNLVDAWRAVGPPLAETRGSRVLIAGGVVSDGGSIGLYAVAFARGLGASEIHYVTSDAVLAAKARALGASVAHIEGAYPDLGRFDVTVDTSGIPEGLAFALRSTGPAGVCTCTAGAVHRSKPVPLPVYEMYMNVVTLRTGWVHTRAMLDEPLRLIAGGLFDPTNVASVHDYDAAADVFTEPFTKLIFSKRQT